MKKLLKLITIFSLVFIIVGCSSGSESDSDNEVKMNDPYQKKDNQTENKISESEFAYIGDLDGYIRNFKRLEGKNVKVIGLWDQGYFVSFDNTTGNIVSINSDLDTSVINDLAAVTVSGKAVKNENEFCIEATNIDYLNPVDNTNLYWTNTSPLEQSFLSDCFSNDKVIDNTEVYFIKINGKFQPIGTYAKIYLYKAPLKLSVEDGTIVRFLLTNIKVSKIHNDGINADIVEYNIEGTMF